MSKKNIIVLSIIAIVAVISLVLFQDSDQVDDTVTDVISEADKESEGSLESQVNRLLEISSTVTTEDVEANIVGHWRNLENPNYTVEFTSLGVMTERLGPNETIGLWKLVNYKDGPNSVIGSTAFSGDGVFLRQSLDEGKSHYYYKVAGINSSRLTVIYLHESGVLNFEKIN